MTAWQRRYGDVFTVRFLGLGHLVYVADPRLVREVYAADGEVGRAGDARRPFLEPLVGERSLLCLEGKAWARQRKLLAPAFHGRRVLAWTETIREIAEREVATWPRGEPFALRPRMQVVTLEVILRVVFGVRDAERLDELRRVVPRLIELGANPLISGLPPLRRRLERSPLLRRLPANPLPRFEAARAELDELLFAEIARRRAELAEGEARDDVLSLLLEARDEDGEAMSDQELRDELVTLLEAGHETTATALAWAFERLVRHRSALERLREEVAEGEGEYLGAVIREVLRSRPVVVDTPRALARPLALGGYRLPAGWYVAPAIPLVHRARALYPDGADFRPERFLEDSNAGEGWIPFGGGERRCLGQQLAMLELRTVVPAVLRSADLRPADPAPERQRLQHVTLAPSELARVVASPA